MHAALHSSLAALAISTTPTINNNKQQQVGTNSRAAVIINTIQTINHIMVRRSSRTRTHAVSMYDEAVAELEKLEASPPPSG